MKKTKPKFIGFIILLVIAIVLAAGGGIYMSTYQKNWPIQVTSRITFTQTRDDSGRYNMGGKIKNTSDKTIILDEDTFALTYKTPGGSMTFRFHGYDYYNHYHNVEYYFHTTELAPGEELDLSTMPTIYGEVKYTNSNMNSFKMTVDGTTYNLTAGNTWVIVIFICAGVLAFIAVIVLLSSLTVAKAQNKVIEYAENNIENSMVVSGLLTNKKDAAKNLGKSVASVMGGALSAAFLGVGFYKVYSTGVRCNFILGKDKIYAYNQADRKLSAEKAVVIDSTVLPEVKIVNKNNNVVLTTTDKKTSITFNTKGSGYTVDEVNARLNEIFTNVVTSDNK